jgi:hypothetical protein
VWGGAFRRGFLVEVKFANAATFERHANRVFTATPVETLSFGSLTSRTLRKVAHSEHLARLALLDLRGHGLADSGAQTLVTADGPWRLRALWLGDNRIGDVGAQALAGWPVLASVRELYLIRNQIGAAGAQALAASPYLAGLTNLTIYDNPLGPAGVQALAASTHLGQLVNLDLIRTQAGDPGAQALVASPHLSRLTRLLFHGNGISATVRAALFDRFGERVVWCNRS